MPRPAVLVMGMAMLIPGCGSTSASPSDAVESPPEPVVSASPFPSASANEAAALEGTWRTNVVSEADIESTLREAGLDEWIEPLRNLPAEDPPAESNVFILEVDSGLWDLSWEPDGGVAQEIDYDATYEVDGDTVVVSHEGDYNTYRWSVDGKTLELEWLDTTYEPYQGIPEEVFQRAFYQTAEFEKQE
jgi:hypothetical protein